MRRFLRSKTPFLLATLVLSVAVIQSPFFKLSYAESYKRGVLSKLSRLTKPIPSVQTVVPLPTLSPVGQITKKVLVLDFDPIINGKRSLHDYKGWNDPATLQNQYISDVKNSSHQYVNYQVVNTQVIRDYPVKTEGFKFTESQYLGCLTNSTPTYCNQSMDYNKLLSDYSVCEQVNNGSIDELWVFGAPYFGYWEANMAGPTAFNTNGPVVTGTTCQKNLHIMGFNYERTNMEMVHNLGHRSESTLIKVFGPWAINLNTPWNRFSMPNKDMAGKASCGNIHFPPNGTYDYDYGNQTYVSSRCEDWLNYPSTTGTTVQSNCSQYNCVGSGSLIINTGSYYEKWWLTHLPYAVGTTNGKLNNWWAYIVDYDNAVARSANENDKWYIVEDGANDYNNGCTSSTNGNEIYLGAGSSCGGKYTSNFKFPNVAIPKNTIITDAYLEFVADGPYTNSIVENIVLNDGATITPSILWPITDTWLSQTKVRSVSLTSTVQQLINSGSWSLGKTINVKMSYSSGEGERRVFALEREAMAGARLFIKTSNANPVPTPTPTPTPTQTPVAVPTTLIYSITNGSNDYEYGCDYSVIYNNSKISLGENFSCTTNTRTQAHFLFDNVQIPINAKIKSAVLKLTSDSNYTSPLSLYFSVSLPLKHLTSSSTNWILSNWSRDGIVISVDMHNELEQILDWNNVYNTTPWKPGDPVRFVMSNIPGSGSGLRRIYSFEGSPAMSAKFEITYTN